MKIVLVILLCLTQTLVNAQNNQITKAEVDARLKEIVTRGKAALNKPVKPSAAGKWLIGKWKGVYSWTDKNDNNILDGKEKSDGESTLSVEFKADGTLCFYVKGAPGGICNSNWEWGSGNIIWISNKFFSGVTYWQISAMTEKGFIMEEDPYTKTKKGVSTYDANKPHSKSLFEKMDIGADPTLPAKNPPQKPKAPKKLKKNF